MPPQCISGPLSPCVQLCRHSWCHQTIWRWPHCVQSPHPSHEYRPRAQFYLHHLMEKQGGEEMSVTLLIRKIIQFDQQGENLYTKLSESQSSPFLWNTNVEKVNFVWKQTALWVHRNTAWQATHSVVAPHCGNIKTQQCCQIHPRSSVSPQHWSGGRTSSKVCSGTSRHLPKQEVWWKQSRIGGCICEKVNPPHLTAVDGAAPPKTRQDPPGTSWAAALFFLLICLARVTDFRSQRRQHKSQTCKCWSDLKRMDKLYWA